MLAAGLGGIGIVGLVIIVIIVVVIFARRWTKSEARWLGTRGRAPTRGRAYRLSALAAVSSAMNIATLL
jgi:hypothetical protein